MQDAPTGEIAHEGSRISAVLTTSVPPPKVQRRFVVLPCSRSGSRRSGRPGSGRLRRMDRLPEPLRESPRLSYPSDEPSPGSEACHPRRFRRAGGFPPSRLANLSGRRRFGRAFLAARMSPSNSSRHQISPSRGSPFRSFPYGRFAFALGLGVHGGSLFARAWRVQSLAWRRQLSRVLTGWRRSHRAWGRTPPS